MSKKKATMSLKDFHGGSIPSDLPLPSAPGVVVRPSDRANYDRQGSWGNPIGRSDQRLRPGSAGSARPFDDRAPFLTTNLHVGRNFDEDERKPLDASSSLHRLVSDEGIHAPPSMVEPRLVHSSGGRAPSGPISTPVTHLSVGNADGSSTTRFGEAIHVGGPSQHVNSGGSNSALEVNRVGVDQQFHGNAVVSSLGMHPNAWRSKKEAFGANEQFKASNYASDATSKLAHASALEQVSSGRWHMKQSLQHQANVRVGGYPETASEFHSMSNNSYSRSVNNTTDVVVRKKYDDIKLAEKIEKSLSVNDDGHVTAKSSSAYRQAEIHMISDTKDKISSSVIDGNQHATSIGGFGGCELQSAVHSESIERRKLNLLPRSKPLDDPEPHAGYLQALGPVDNNNESHITSNGIHISESMNRMVERPKLNLKPRSQPLEDLDGKSERERSTLFGGARPRELVLKERGMPDVVSNNPSQPSIRVKQDTPKAEIGFSHTTLTHYDAKMENIPNPKRTERQDHHGDAEKTGAQKRNYRSDNWRSGRDVEKQQLPQDQLERPPSPETWRRPSVQPEATHMDASMPRFGKAASAVDLALAFSKSISDPKAGGHHSGQRGLANHDHVPFSRLTGTNTKPRISGF